MNVSYKCQVTTSAREEGYQSPNRTSHPMDSVVVWFVQENGQKRRRMKLTVVSTFF